MPENTADDGEGAAKADADAGKGMPQIVKADVLQFCLFANPPPGFLKIDEVLQGGMRPQFKTYLIG